MPSLLELICFDIHSQPASVWGGKVVILNVILHKQNHPFHHVQQNVFKNKVISLDNKHSNKLKRKGLIGWAQWKMIYVWELSSMDLSLLPEELLQTLPYTWDGHTTNEIWHPPTTHAVPPTHTWYPSTKTWHTFIILKKNANWCNSRQINITTVHCVCKIHTILTRKKKKKSIHRPRPPWWEIFINHTWYNIIVSKLSFTTTANEHATYYFWKE